MFFCVSFVVLILDSLIDGIDAACTVMAGVYHHAPSARREGARDNNYLNKSLGYDSWRKSDHSIFSNHHSTTPNNIKSHCICFI